MTERSRVKVVVRVRPQLEEDNIWVQPISSTILQTLNHRNIQESLQYEFASVYGSECKQKELYDGCVKPMLGHILKGRNASVFAYGPTGSGKTHTILGTADNPGIIPRCLKDMFSLLEETSQSELEESYDSNVQFSYLEIYNEKVLDLVEPGVHTDLPIREDSHKKIFVAGLAWKNISSVDEFNQIFGSASKNRTTAATDLNKYSSRSHSVLVVKVSRKQKQAPFRKLTGKMYIIDLAGSEDNRRTGNQGIRLKESGAINTSLMSLGLVVDALNTGQPCVPYRASKLTRLLQDSLGGSAITCMIVNLAPEERHYCDTHSTLRFACKTKKIVNTVTVNESFDRPAVKKCAVKRAAPDSTEDVESKKQKVEAETVASSTEKVASSTEKVQAKTPCKQSQPQPFLSPLLRQQASLRTEMLSRLEALEGRLLDQMTSQANLSDQQQPDSTSQEDSEKRDPFNELRKLQEKLLAMNPHPSASSNVEAVKSPAPITPFGATIIPETPEYKKKALGDKTNIMKAVKARGAGAKQKVGKVFSDGSTMDSGPPEYTSSPLFRRDVTTIKRTGVRSTETPIPPSAETPVSHCRTGVHSSAGVRSTAAALPQKDPQSHFNTDVQRKHNERIMSLLNTGSLQDLQTLQRVGAKRASLIYSWRELNGNFQTFDDLNDIVGLTPKYISTLLKSNLVNLQV